MALAQEPFLTVDIPGSFRVPSESGDFMIYDIRSISTDPLYLKPTFKTRRPYSEFEDLRQLLVSRHGDVEIPEIPPRVAPDEELSDNIIQIRMTGFQRFINQVLAIEELKSDPFVLKFIQSHDTMDKIRQEVESNSQTEETTSQDNPDERDSSSSDSAASVPSADECIFVMDHFK